MNTKFWKWYDNLNEPKRFFFAILVLGSPIHIGNGMAILMDDPKYFLIMGLILPIIISRIIYLKYETYQK